MTFCNRGVTTCLVTITRDRLDKDPEPAARPAAARATTDPVTPTRFRVADAAARAVVTSSEGGAVGTASTMAMPTPSRPVESVAGVGAGGGRSSITPAPTTC